MLPGPRYPTVSGIISFLQLKFLILRLKLEPLCGHVEKTSEPIMDVTTVAVSIQVETRTAH